MQHSHTAKMEVYTGHSFCVPEMQTDKRSSFVIQEGSHENGLMEVTCTCFNKLCSYFTCSRSVVIKTIKTEQLVKETKCPSHTQHQISSSGSAICRILLSEGAQVYGIDTEEKQTCSYQGLEQQGAHPVKSNDSSFLLL